jgi:3-hydroxyisobutyrate dehydrogenase
MRSERRERSEEMDITFIGAGMMGRGMIRTLLQKGHTVTAYDVTAKALEQVREFGARTSDSLEEAVAGSQFILMSLPGPKQVIEVIKEILEIKKEEIGDVFVIDFSTIDPKTSKQMASLCSQEGVTYFEAPVSGGPQGANAGTLSIMVGGEEAKFADIEPILYEIGKSIYYLGQTGTASLVKLCNNVVVATTAVALGEAFVLASAGGICPQQLAEVLSKSVGGSKTLEIFGPHMTSGEFEPSTFSLGLMFKDLGLFMETAKEYGISTLSSSLTYQLYNSAFAQGWGQQDHSVVMRVLESLGQAQAQVHTQPIQEQEVK